MSLFSPFFEVERIERRSNEILWLWEQDQTKPITLYLSSQGGDAVVAAAFRNTIKLNKVDLHVVVVGEAHSAALIILSAGTKRVAWKGARFFFHDLATRPPGGQRTIALTLLVDLDGERLAAVGMILGDGFSSECGNSQQSENDAHRMI